MWYFLPFSLWYLEGQKHCLFVSWKIRTRALHGSSSVGNKSLSSIVIIASSSITAKPQLPASFGVYSRSYFLVKMRTSCHSRVYPKNLMYFESRPLRRVLVVAMHFFVRVKLLRCAPRSCLGQVRAASVISAKVPVVKCVDSASHLAIDLVIGAANGCSAVPFVRSHLQRQVPLSTQTPRHTEVEKIRLFRNLRSRVLVCSTQQ